MKKSLATYAVLITLSGCAINLKTANIYADAGYAAMNAGNWNAARQYFSRAVVNVDVGMADLGMKAAMNFEYGRALGVTCEYELAESYLLRAKEFTEQNGKSPYLPLYELGLLNEQQGKFLKAEAYFAHLMPILEQDELKSLNAIGVADAYDRYGRVLLEMGKPSEAESYRKRAKDILAKNRETKPLGRPTPYGTVCTTSA